MGVINGIEIKHSVIFFTFERLANKKFYKDRKRRVAKMKIFNLKSNKVLLISLLSLSNALDLSAIDQLPFCEGGHITSKSGQVGESQVPRDACRWLIENEQEKQIKVTLHELTSDCRDSEDEIYLLNAKRSVFGPFCAPVEQRHRRETEVNLEHEVELPSSADEIEGVFDGDAVEVIYVTAPGGYKFRFKFYFEWELIEMPLANGTFIEIGGNKDPIFPDRPVDPNTVPATGVCGPEHFAPASLGIFAYKLEQTSEPESAMEAFAKFAAAMTGFEKYFDTHFAEYCTIESTQLPCEFFHYPSDVSAQEILGHLDALVGHIIINCKEGFGHLWLKELSELRNLVGGEIPSVVVPDFSTPLVGDGHLCDECRVDSDCGDFHDKWMRCSSESRQCVCANHWIDDNGNPADGCEKFSGDYVMNHGQCSGEPVATTKATTTKVTTTTATKTTEGTPAAVPFLCGECASDSDCGKPSKLHMVCSSEGQCICDDSWTSTSQNNFDGCRTFQASYVKDETQCSPEPPTTAPPTNSDETTAIVDHANVFNVIEVGDKCPQQWLAVPMQADDNLWSSLDDGLHEHAVPMCAFENLPACTKPLFASAASSSCHSETLISNYNTVVDELARVSVSGDFDRTCLFAVAHAPCSVLDFKAVADAREFAYKFADVVKTYAIEKCGKEHLKNALAPLLMQNIDILDNAANGICPSALDELSYNEQAFDNADYASMPIITTTTSTVADTAPRTTPKPASDISGKFTTLSDGQCAAKAFGRLAPVVFNARAFDLVDADQAKASFKEFAEEIGRLGKKTVKYEGLRSSRPSCQIASSGKMPCDLLSFPSREMACQLATRTKKLFLHVRMSCNDSWIKFYGNTIASLLEAARPTSGSCPELGERMAKNKLREYTERHEDLNGGVEFREQLSSIKQEIKENRTSKYEERANRIAKKKEKGNNKEKRQQEKLKNMARKRIESAMVEVNKKQQKLEQLRIAIAAAEAGNFALLARDEESDVVVEETPEEMLMDGGQFDYYEYEAEESEEGECTVPVGLEIDEAVTFFNALVEAQASPRSKLLHNAVSHRVKRRFEDVLNFIRLGPGRCPEEGVLASCSDVALVYGGRRAKITDIIEAASQLVQNIEEQCEGASFAEHFLSVHGKADNIF